jgi:CubicO group peptidase (beta-lactamase class C family)
MAAFFAASALGARASTPDIDSLVSRIEREKIDVHAIMVVRGGETVCERYLGGFGAGELHDTASVTKSVMAILIGILIDRGYLENEGRSLEAALSGHGGAGDFGKLGGLSVADLLSMRRGPKPPEETARGIPFAEPGLLIMMQSDSWMEAVRGMDIPRPRGDALDYNSVNYHLLSILVSRLAGMSAARFAEAFLFGPHGISRYEWDGDPDGNSLGWGNLRLDIRDLAKIARLVQRGGEWRGRRIVSAAWIGRMLSPKTRAPWNPVFRMEYGYGWFLPSGFLGGFSAAIGRGGQCALLFPERDMEILVYGNFALERILFGLRGLRAGKDGPPAAASPSDVRASLDDGPKASLPGPEALRRLSGAWMPRDPDFFLRDFSLEIEVPASGRCRYRVASRAFSTGGEAPSSGRGRPRACLRALADGRTELLIEEIGNINAFRLRLKPLGSPGLPGALQVELYERVLFPRPVRVVLVRRGT